MRRRILNPEFFVDPDIIANLDFGGRLFYQGLWCVAEDSGVFDPNPLGLKMKIFPGDNLEVSVIQQYYQALLQLDKIIEYEVSGRTYAWLKNFHKHQKLDRPSPPSLPLPSWVVWHGEEEYGKEKHRWHYEVLPVPNPSPFDDCSTNIRRADDEQTTTEENRKEGNRKEGNRKESECEENRREGGVGETNAAPSHSPSPSLSLPPPPNAHALEETPEDIPPKILQVLRELKAIKGYPFDFRKDLDFVRDLTVEFPTLDLLEEVKKWRTYKLDKPLKAKSNPRLQFRNWLQKALEWRKEDQNGKNCKHPRADPGQALKLEKFLWRGS